MTGALNLIKEEFDETSIIPAIIKQHETFLTWFNKVGGNKQHLVDLLMLFRTYSKDRPFQNKEWQGKAYKAYKKIGDYKTVEELAVELAVLRQKNPTKMLDKVYLNLDLSVMTVGQIKKQWYWLNNLANTYGHIVHLSIEDRFLHLQGLVDIDERMVKLADIQLKYENLKTMLGEVDLCYNGHHFNPYRLDCTALEFRDYVEGKYDSIELDYGIVTVPENVVFSDRWQICGTSDQKPVLDSKTFNINDYKTNKNYTYHSEHDSMLLAPFQHIEHCEHNDYTIQLNGYSAIVSDNTDMLCKERNVIYWNRNEQIFELIPIEQKEADSIKLLDLHLAVQNTQVDKFRTSGILNNVDSRYHIYISKHLKYDIDKRKKDGTLDNSSKTENRIYYQNFIRDKIMILEREIG
jgi:hypothetical protein